jgi:SAM-dependent methyltransferase
MLRTEKPLRCPDCHSQSFQRNSLTATCLTCGHSYPVRYGIIDFLPAPNRAVTHELRGLAAENNLDVEDDLERVKYLRTEHIDTTSELMTKSRHERTQYYQQTSAAFYEGLSRARPDAGLRVLEIGSERTFFKLRTIRDLCDEAYALNIFFHITAENEHLDWPVRILGDMNDIPIGDNYLDLIICSATIHHSNSLDKALAEVARVLRPSGRALILNEPIEGWLKARGLERGVARHSRHDDIHEDPVTWRQWTDGIKGSGLLPDFFLPAWFLQQVASADSLPDDVRFGSLARIVRPVLRNSLIQDLVRTMCRAPGQALLGLPLNVVLWKGPH